MFTKTGGNKAKAAALLGVPTSTLKSKMKKYGIQ
ncbi:MAG: helix-turn-helix domain-containing protein [bacterium]